MMKKHLIVSFLILLCSVECFGACENYEHLVRRLQKLEKRQQRFDSVTEKFATGVGLAAGIVGGAYTGGAGAYYSEVAGGAIGTYLASRGVNYLNEVNIFEREIRKAQIALCNEYFEKRNAMLRQIEENESNGYNVDLTDHHKWVESVKKKNNEKLEKLENDINAFSNKIELIVAEQESLEKELQRSDVGNRQQLKNRMLSLANDFKECIGIIENLKETKYKHDRVVERSKKRKQIYSQYF